MCQARQAADPVLLTAVDAVLADLTGSNKLFTAFDVTRLVRAKGITVRHAEVRELVVDTYRDGLIPNYDCTLHQTPNFEARVFHPLGEDVTCYNPDDLAPGVGQPAATTAASACASTASTASGSRTQNVDGDGRLPIYGDITRQAGLQPYQRAFIVVDGAKMKIDGSLAGGNSYMVNKDGRIRISGDLLSVVFKGAQKYSISVDNGRIYVVSA
jgi:hypothetical protein